MAGWNFAELWERIADRFPDAQAQVQGDRRTTWSEFDRRADGLARHLLDGGAQHQDKVALYLLITIAPFAVVAPVLTAVFGRFPGAYRAVMTAAAKPSR